MRQRKNAAEAASVNPAQQLAMRPLKTGVPGLDAMLRGGIPRYAVVVIAGQPGSGKTILCQQMLFANIPRGQQCVYLTTVSESPMKVAKYQSQFSFFDASKFGKSVVYMDIGQIIRSQGLREALDAIMDSLRDVQPTVVAIDSFKAIHDLATSSQEMRTFIYDLSVELAATQTTSLLVGEYAENEIGVQPEFAIADGIIWLYSQAQDNQLSRYIRILKMRGMDYNATPQNFEITKDGISVFTLEGLVPDRIAPYGKGTTKTGLDELDELLRGGIPRGAPLLITGGAGTGKTTLCLQYIYEGAKKFGEKGVYMSYEEVPEQIIANASRFGWDLQALIDQGLIKIFHVPLPKINPHEQLLFMRNAIRDFGAQRAVVDSLTMMMTRVGSPDMIRNHVYNLVSILKDLECTTMIVSDPPIGARVISRFGVEESIIDGVIILKMVSEKGSRVRYLEVYKLRGVSHASGDNVMKITERGIKVFPRLQEAL